MKKANLYIDGFNFYHALDSIKISGQPRHDLKWLDFTKLGKLLIRPQTEVLHQVYFFTAIPKHLSQEKQTRHLRYLEALESAGVKVVLGIFKNTKGERCPKCGNIFYPFREKKSDVALAVNIVSDALLDNYDRAFLITADTDLVPAVETVLKNKPNKEITLVRPPFRSGTNELIQKCNNERKLKIKHLEECLLPAEVVAKNGHIILRPQKYTP